MASGRLGVVTPAANTETTLYTVPANVVATVNLLACNKNTTSTTVRVAVSTGASAGAGDFIEYDVTLQPNGGVLERSGVVMSAGERLLVRSSAADVCFRAHGFEESI